MKPDRQGLSSLQLLRGLAATMVVMLHSGERFMYALGGPFPFPGWVGAGYSGVDIFFVLSGFIIFYAHRDDLGTRKVKTYALKRFIRVYPIFWIVMLLALALSFVNPYVAHGEAFDPSFYLKSFFLVPQQRTPFISVSWTLVHEVRFYATFAVLICLRPRRALAVAAGLMTASAAMLAIESLAPGRLPGGSFAAAILFLVHPTTIEFGLGALAAYLALHWRTPAWLDDAIVSAGAVSMCLALVFGERVVPLSLKYHAVITFSLPALLLVLGCVLVERRWSPAMPRLLTFLGDASYSIYLVHKPILAMLPAIVFAEAASRGRIQEFGCCSAALCLAGGCLFYQVCERPLLARLRTLFLRGGERRGRTLAAVVGDARIGPS